MSHSNTPPQESHNAARRGQHVPVDDASKKDMASWKPGSEAELAKDVANAGDFGVHSTKATQAERDYTNRNTQVSDHGASQPWSNESADAARTSGAGGRNSGEGSSSGGNLDTDIVGVGTGGSGISQSGPGSRPGADDTTGSSQEFASGGPAKGTVPANASVFSGSTIPAPRENDPDFLGADAASRPDLRDDDSFKGEISSGEARGEDNDMRR